VSEIHTFSVDTRFPFDGMAKILNITEGRTCIFQKSHPNATHFFVLQFYRNDAAKLDLFVDR
jgi:hypothetical protein